MFLLICRSMDDDLNGLKWLSPVKCVFLLFEYLIFLQILAMS